MKKTTDTMARATTREPKRDSAALPSAQRSGDPIGVLLGAVVLVLASMVVGVAVNSISSRGIPLFPTGDQPSLPEGLARISLEDAVRAHSTHSAAFVDARSPDEYAQGHIAGALSIPAGNFEERYLAVADAVNAAPALVAYCSGPTCSDAIQLAERLQEAYPGPIYVLEVGWSAWQAAGYPTQQGSAPE